MFKKRDVPWQILLRLVLLRLLILLIIATIVLVLVITVVVQAYVGDPVSGLSPRMECLTKESSLAAALPSAAAITTTNINNNNSSSCSSSNSSSSSYSSSSLSVRWRSLFGPLPQDRVQTFNRRHVSWKLFHPVLGVAAHAQSAVGLVHRATCEQKGAREMRDQVHQG